MSPTTTEQNLPEGRPYPVDKKLLAMDFRNELQARTYYLKLVPLHLGQGGSVSVSSSRVTA